MHIENVYTLSFIICNKTGATDAHRKCVHTFIQFVLFSLQEDTETLQKEKLSDNATLCVQLRRCEKNILSSAAEYAAKRKQKLQPKQETT